MDTIIVGLIVLAVVGVIAYLKRDLLLSRFSKKDEGSVPITPQEMAAKPKTVEAYQDSLPASTRAFFPDAAEAARREEYRAAAAAQATPDVSNDFGSTATVKHRLFKAGVPVKFQLTIDNPLWAYSVIKLSSNPDSVGKRAACEVVLRRLGDDAVQNFSQMNMSETSFGEMATRVTLGRYEFTVTTSADYGCSVHSTFRK